MLESNGPLREEVLAYYEARFGVQRSAFDGFLFHETSGEIWGTTGAPPASIAARRPSGLRVLRRTPTGLKPTSAFLTHLGPRVTAARVVLSSPEMEALLLGRRLEVEEPEGYVALCLGADVVGCGRVGDGRLQAVIPTGRRRELLLALEGTATQDEAIL